MAGTTRSPRLGPIVVALVFVFFQLIMWPAATAILVEWEAVGKALAAIGVIWALAATAMAFAALWLLVSLGRHSPPLWIGGGASLVAGTVWTVGLLAHVVPCSGPT